MKPTDNNQTSGIKRISHVAFVQFPLAIVRMAIVSVIFIGIAHMLPSGISQTRAEEKVKPTNPTILSSTSLKTIIVANYYPWTFVNERGIPDGFSVDIAKAVSDVMGCKLEITTDTWENATKALADGNIDLLPMMAVSVGRDKMYDFSVPHTIAYDAIFSRNGSQRIRSLKDLNGKTVIVMNKDAAHDYLLSSGMASKMKLVLVDSLPDALRVVAAGKADAALMPKLVGLITMKKLNLTNLDPSPVVIDAYNRPFSFAVKDGNQALLERLGQGLSIIKSTGQYQEIYNKWFGALEPPGVSWETAIKYIVFIIAVFLLITLGFILWTVSLRKQVALRTKKIADEIEERKHAEKELRESEERYKALFDRSLDCVYIHDFAGNFLDANEAALNLLGYTREELATINFATLLSDDQTPLALQSLQEIMDTGYQKNVTGYRLKRRNGNDVYVETIGSLILREGKPYAIQAIARDISSRKQVEEEKQILEERLGRAEKMEALGLLAGGVAHDLNNVLGIVVGYAELLLSTTDAENPIREDLITIMDGGQRAAAIVDDLLTLARRGVVGRKILNLNKLISDLQKSSQLRKLLSYNPHVQIKTDLDSDLLNISGSSVHLEKTLYNLISNAAEAMTKGGTLTIKTTNRYIDKPVHGYDNIREGDYVVLSVSDTGEGISESDLKRIFEPFYTKKIMGRSGTGLGLSVVWGTVKDHLGYIDVQSEEGKGTTFSLYFLITREDIPSEAVTVSLSEYMGKGQSILVVDDVKQQRDLASRLLKSLNYNVMSAASGEDAVEYLKDHKIDLLVLDMIMDPGMDGLDTYKSILQIHPKQKAIIVSGFSESDRVQEAQALGSGAYVKKPYVIEKLGMVVKEELERK